MGQERPDFDAFSEEHDFGNCQFVATMHVPPLCRAKSTSRRALIWYENMPPPGLYRPYRCICVRTIRNNPTFFRFADTLSMGIDISEPTR
jgi:hypothetical protein